MKSTTVAIVAVLLLFVFRLDTQVFISAGVVMARDVKRAVCPSDITLTCDQKTSHLREDNCPEEEMRERERTRDGRVRDEHTASQPERGRERQIDRKSVAAMKSAVFSVGLSN
ncbi:hypothetical protein V1264_024939 [Littorina saxatilis]|uniref:Secreted protein n=1 Tax=Littorina saxatilis TaxID=31220 RepID=A0AAN9AM97_9CAEN